MDIYTRYTHSHAYVQDFLPFVHIRIVLADPIKNDIHYDRESTSTGSNQWSTFLLFIKERITYSRVRWDNYNLVFTNIIPESNISSVFK